MTTKILRKLSQAAQRQAREAARNKLLTGNKKPESTGTADKGRVMLGTLGGKTAGMADRLKTKMQQLNKIEDKKSEKAQLLRNAISDMKSKLPKSVVTKVEDSIKTKMNKGGKATKKVPVISIGVGMAEMKKDPSKKAKMMRGGMANKKEHMYAGGGSVTDKLKPMPTGSKGKGLRNLPDSVQMNMGFNPKS